MFLSTIALLILKFIELYPMYLQYFGFPTWKYFIKQKGYR